MNKLALPIWLDILSGAIEKKSNPGDHEPHLKKSECLPLPFNRNGNRLYKGGEPDFVSQEWHNTFAFKRCLQIFKMQIPAVFDAKNARVRLKSKASI